jgi:hypothetical protein
MSHAHVSGPRDSCRGEKNSVFSRVRARIPEPSARQARVYISVGGRRRARERVRARGAERREVAFESIIRTFDLRVDRFFLLFFFPRRMKPATTRECQLGMPYVCSI